ncbi:MAG: DUF4147 domain-containing protein [Bryobacterales bacterium]|nr:DUF4147 domain-containing protein [Bryobacterales bacterium]
MTGAGARSVLLRLFRETLEELSLGRVMASAVALRGGRLMAGGAEVNVTEPERIFVAAIGKAARPMCDSIAPMLPADRTSFAVVAPGPAQPASQGMQAFAGGHPYPNTESEAAARHVLATARELGSRDLLVCLLSGGGSAICEAPLDPEVSLEDLREFFRVLVTCGGNIVEMNVLRKHFSLIKGGRLAEAAAPARQLTLYVSDVPAGEPSSVASGPTMPDESSSEDAYEIAARLGIVSRLPPSIRRRFERRDLPETPKPGGEAFRRGQWACLLDNSDALESLESKLTALGWILERDLSVDDQPVDEAADTLLDRLEGLAAAHPGRTVAVTTGGELSSPVTGDGIGGRNQAFVLWAARKVAERGMDATVLSAGTDGIDGNSPAAGAIADQTTVARAGAMGMDPADFERRSDSYRFFHRLGDLIVTGPTGNNVRDLRMLVAGLPKGRRRQDDGA